MAQNPTQNPAPHPAPGTPPTRPSRITLAWTWSKDRFLALGRMARILVILVIVFACFLCAAAPALVQRLNGTWDIDIDSDGIGAMWDHCPRDPGPENLCGCPEGIWSGRVCNP